jgi:hypothetical protein
MMTTTMAKAAAALQAFQQRVSQSQRSSAAELYCECSVLVSLLSRSEPRPAAALQAFLLQVARMKATVTFGVP